MQWAWRTKGTKRNGKHKVGDPERWRFDKMTLWVIRVDIAMSALSSAIHNTGHYRVRPRAVGSSPCERPET